MRIRSWKTRSAAVGAVAVTALALGLPSAAQGRTPQCRVFRGDPERTVATLTSRSLCTQGELDALYAGLGAGPMPTYASVARGYWRWDPGYTADTLEPAHDRLTSRFFWNGKIFYTRPGGGWLVNRYGDDAVDAFPAQVTYGPGQWDGHRAILVDYTKCPRPDSQFASLFLHDEMRRVQTGVYLGFGWWAGSKTWPGDHGQAKRFVTFVLDLTRPGVPGALPTIRTPTGCQPRLPSQ